MAFLAGIWDAPKAVSMSFTQTGDSVHVAIATDCIDTCTHPNNDLQLDGGIPPQYRPSSMRVGLAKAIKQDTAYEQGVFCATPDGYLGFTPPSGWATDTGTTKSGVAAQTFSYTY